MDSKIRLRGGGRGLKKMLQWASEKIGNSFKDKNIKRDKKLDLIVERVTVNGQGLDEGGGGGRLNLNKVKKKRESDWLF